MRMDFQLLMTGKSKSFVHQREAADDLVVFGQMMRLLRRTHPAADDFLLQTVVGN